MPRATQALEGFRNLAPAKMRLLLNSGWHSWQLFSFSWRLRCSFSGTCCSDQTLLELTPPTRNADLQVGVALLGATLYRNRHRGASDLRLHGGNQETKKMGLRFELAPVRESHSNATAVPKGSSQPACTPRFGHCWPRLWLRRASSQVFLEIFAGAQAIAKHLRRGGFGVVALDLCFSPLEDVQHPAVLNVLQGWISSGAVLGVWLGTPCTTWSIAHTALIVRISTHMWCTCFEKAASCSSTAGKRFHAFHCKCYSQLHPGSRT